MALPDVRYPVGSIYQGLQVMDTDYETMFADLPDEIGAADAMLILGVASVQGVTWIISHLPADAPQVTYKYIAFGKRRYRLYNKAEIIALRRYRDNS